MIKIINISKSYSGKKVLDNVNIEIGQGDFVAITGKSGSGKSTLLNIIGTLEKPDGGKVFIDEKDLSTLNGKEAAVLRNRLFGYVFQSFHLEPTYTVLKNIEIPLLIARKPKSERFSRISEVLAKVDLTDKINAKTSVLSGGEKQRAAIARALANNPQIILADEPTGNLDTVNGKAVIGLLRSMADEGITILLVTHSMIDAQSADRIIQLEDGKIKC